MEDYDAGNNSDMPVPPVNCLDFGTLTRAASMKGPFKGRKYDTWETAKFACDQQ